MIFCFPECRLYHLVDGTVSVGRQEPFAEDGCHLVEQVALLVEMQCLPRQVLP